MGLDRYRTYRKRERARTQKHIFLARESATVENYFAACSAGNFFRCEQRLVARNPAACCTCALATRPRKSLSQKQKAPWECAHGRHCVAAMFRFLPTGDQICCHAERADRPAKAIGPSVRGFLPFPRFLLHDLSQNGKPLNRQDDLCAEF